MAKRFRRTAWMLAVASGLAFALPAVAQPATPHAQAASQAIPPAPDALTNVQSTKPQQTEPVFQVLGIRIGLAAPVPPPYEATSFTTFAGQPMTSVDQVMSQQFTKP